MLGGSGYGGNYAAILALKIYEINLNPTIMDKLSLTGLITGNSAVTKS